MPGVQYVRSTRSAKTARPPRGQQQGGGGQKSDQPNKKSGSPQLVRQDAERQESSRYNKATDQISFYDETLKKQIEGSFVSDGKSIHVSSPYGVKSVPYNDLGASIDHDAQVLLVQKVLSELAREAAKGMKSH